MINFLLFSNSAIYGKSKNDKGLNYKPIGSGTEKMRVQKHMI